jgi:REP element-mobilizing transposase RayT
VPRIVWLSVVGGRKLRLEFPGACYHVINRGNYRRDIFESDRAKAAFEHTLFEACEKSDWRVHAYVIMRNHFHLAIDTPAGNLVAGMQWLQATFANRFNRLRREKGHLFQGRYKAILVERGAALGCVSHYIHLNPVRAHILPVERLAEYRYSSFWFLDRPSRRPPWLRLQDVLAEAGGLNDTAAGWAAYRAYLQWQAADGPLDKAEAHDSMCRGWAVGSEDFKAALLQDHALAASARAWGLKGAQEMKAQAWEDMTAWALRQLGRREEELIVGAKSEPWKVAVALLLKQRTQASNSWLARRLKFGRAKYVSRLVNARPQRAEVLSLAAALRGKWAT